MIYVFIPARYGSTRFPGKPLALIGGLPMVRHVYDRARACPEVREVYVATDDPRVYRCVEEFGGRAVMTDPGHPSGSDRICEAALKVGVKQEDIVVNIQGDQPAFDSSVLPSLTRPFAEDPGIPMTTLMWRFRKQEDVFNPNHVKVVTDASGFALYFSRSPIPFDRDGEGEVTYFKHLGFYAFRMEFLRRFTSLPQGVLERAEKLEQLRALENGYKIRVVETEEDSLEVDVPGDLAMVEALLKTASPTGSGKDKGPGGSGPDGRSCSSCP